MFVLHWAIPLTVEIDGANTQLHYVKFVLRCAFEI